MEETRAIVAPSPEILKEQSEKPVKMMDSNPLTKKLNNGRTVTAKLYHGEPMGITYANRTQAEKAAQKIDGKVIHSGRPFYVEVKPKPLTEVTQGRAAAARDVHTVKVAGSNPAPATKSTEAEPMREGHPISEAENKAIHAWYGGHGGSRIKEEDEEEESGKTLDDKLKVETPRIHPLIVKTVKPIGKRPKIKTTPRRHHTARNLGAGIVETRTKGGRRRHLKLT